MIGWHFKIIPAKTDSNSQCGIGFGTITVIVVNTQADFSHCRFFAVGGRVLPIPVTETFPVGGISSAHVSMITLANQSKHGHSQHRLQSFIYIVNISQDSYI